MEKLKELKKQVFQARAILVLVCSASVNEAGGIWALGIALMCYLIMGLQIWLDKLDAKLERLRNGKT